MEITIEFAIAKLALYVAEGKELQNYSVYVPGKGGVKKAEIVLSYGNDVNGVRIRTKNGTVLTNRSHPMVELVLI